MSIRRRPLTSADFKSQYEDEINDSCYYDSDECDDEKMDDCDEDEIDDMHPGPRQSELDKSPSLQHAWNEYLIVRKLLGL